MGLPYEGVFYVERLLYAKEATFKGEILIFLFLNKKIIFFAHFFNKSNQVVH